MQDGMPLGFILQAPWLGGALTTIKRLFSVAEAMPERKNKACGSKIGDKLEVYTERRMNFPFFAIFCAQYICPSLISYTHCEYCSPNNKNALGICIKERLCLTFKENLTMRAASAMR
jgi:hypothetical protein